jgi:hypothetical protein
MSEQHAVRFWPSIPRFSMTLVSTDALSAASAFVFLHFCMLLLGLFLQLPVSKCRSVRAAFGAILATVMLLATPKLYASDTQMLGLSLAFLTVQAAWAVLHWTFLEAHRKPAVWEVCASPYQYTAHGTRKSQQRMQQLLQNEDNKQGSGHPVVLMYGTGRCCPNKLVHSRTGKTACLVGRAVLMY